MFRLSSQLAIFWHHMILINGSLLGGLVQNSHQQTKRLTVFHSMAMTVTQKFMVYRYVHGDLFIELYNHVEFYDCGNMTLYRVF